MSRKLTGEHEHATGTPRRTVDAFIIVLTIVCVAGTYFGSAQLAGSTPTTAPRVVTLRVGDVALFGRLRCAAVTDARPPSAWRRAYYMRCSKRPPRLARYEADISPDAVSVMDVRAGKQLYVTP